MSKKIIWVCEISYLNYNSRKWGLAILSSLINFLDISLKKIILKCHLNILHKNALVSQLSNFVKQLSVLYSTHNIDMNIYGGLGLGLWCLTPLLTISVILWWSVSLLEETVVPGENPWPSSTRRKPLTCSKSLTNFITKSYIEYTSPWAWFKTHNIRADRHLLKLKTIYDGNK